MKKIMTVLLCAALGGCVRPAAEPTPADRLKTHLSRCVEQGKVLFGHQDDLFYGKNWHRWDGGVEHSDIRAVAGDYPAVLGVELGGIELGRERSLDHVPFALIREGIAEHHRRGGIVVVSWHPANPSSGGDSWDVSAGEGVAASLLDGGANRAKGREWLRRLGDFFDSLRDDDGRRIPVVWRPWHELAGNWFWWGAPYCTADDYKALWRMTYDYLAGERGLDNLVWAVSPGFTEYCTTGYTDYWPGDDCVDLVGIDIYQYGTSAEFTDLTRRHLLQLAAVAAARGKLLALTETGCEALPDARWWTGALLPALEGFPVAYVLTWRNAWDRPAHYYAPFEGEASADDFRAFVADERIALLGECNELQ